jgi:hypothetical protein
MNENLKTLLALLALCATLAFGQTAGTTARMDGTVTDPQGAVVVGANVTITNSSTATAFKATTDGHGQWAVPALPQGDYQVTVAATGFRTTIIQNVVMDAGVPATVNTKMQLGSLTETVEVSGAEDLVQATSATINSTIEGQQIFEMPNITRNGLDLLVSQPGVQTSTANRYSSVNGLPNGALTVTMDGLNTQEQLVKSNNGFFSFIPIQQDAVEQVTLTTSAAGADSTGEGAAQMKFVTKSGTNQFHGGGFWQLRNTDLDANYYFNTINHLPRDIVQLNQAGVHVGGPVIKNKVFFFTNVEVRRLPNSTAYTRTVMNAPDLSGNYTYPDSTGALHTVNVLSLAKAAGYNATPDPIIGNTLSQIAALYGNGTLVPNTSAADYDRSLLTYGANSDDRRNFSTTRLDYNITSKHQLSLMYSFNSFYTVSDPLNNVVPIYPGTGTILGTNISTGQKSNRVGATISLRSALTSRLTNEWHAGLQGGMVVEADGAESDSSYAPWKGYVPILGFSLSGVTSETEPYRHNSPTRQVNDTLTYLKARHMVTFGGDFTQVTTYQQYVYTESLPEITFGIATGDPVHTGSTDVFTTATMPGATQTYLDDAAGLYATLTGRVSAITRRVVLNGATQTYGNTPATYDDRQREFGLFAQDVWRVAPSLTVTLGLRYEQQRPFENLNHVYSSLEDGGIWGLSGVGNMFEPGTLTGSAPILTSFQTPYKTPHTWNPSAGLAWQIPEGSGLMGFLFGRHQGASVLRAGYGIATIREGTDIIENILGSNPGLTVDDSVDPVNYPSYFGAPGSVLFSQGTLPSRPYPAAPTYPFAATTTDHLNAFAPNLKMGYVESWNIGFQRELRKNSVIEVRYTGNHGLKEWRQVNLNEVNLFESGFLKEMYIAQNNLTIARGGNINNAISNNFGNQGLPGQQPTPILQTAFGSTTSSSYATDLRQNRMGTIANAIYSNQTYMGRLVAAGYPVNMFVVNPTAASGGAWLVENLGESYYDALQVEVRRRMASGLIFLGSYVWSKSLADGSTTTENLEVNPTTFRNLGLDKAPPSFDIRNAVKFNWVYQLPFGPGRHFLSSGNRVVEKILEGWELNGVGRTQSGSPSSLSTRGYQMDQNDNGIVLQNMTAKQLQSMVSIYKTTGANGTGVVWFLPQSLIKNSNAAFEAGGLSWSNLNVSTPYIGPQLAPYTFGDKVFLYGPWQTHFDLMLLKRLQIREHVNLELRATAFDILNLTDFEFGTVGASSSAFGQTTTAYRDISNAQDPGSRVIEFQARVNF